MKEYASNIVGSNGDREHEWRCQEFNRRRFGLGCKK